MTSRGQHGAPWIRPRERPLVLGHRGARHARPENTLSAFELALSEGAEGVELDVRLNADGEPVACHDADLSRVTGGRDRRRVRALSTAECRRVEVDGKPALPLLSEVLDWAAERGSLLNVELKTDRAFDRRLAERVATLTAPHAASRRIVVSSFSAPTAWRHRLAAPGVDVAWLFASRAAAWLSARAPAFAVAVHPHAKLVTPARIEAWHRAGVRVAAWTVNSPELARQLARAGVDALISDCPARLLEALRANGG